MKKHFRKLASAMLALSLIVTMLPIYGTNNNVSAVTHTLQNPTKNSSGDTVWDCIWFGSYPQAEVIPSGTYTALDSSLLQKGDTVVSDSIYNQLRNATGWDSNGDITISGNKYRRIKKSDATNTFSSSYYYNWSDSTTYHYFKYEPIKWRVLNVNGTDAFLLADKGLDDQVYNTERTEVTWETSNIRSWLNGYGASGNAYGTDYSSKNFIGTAFSNPEQSAIKTTSVINNDNINYGTNGGNNTNDKVFLLSESEVYTDSAKPYGFDSDYSKYDEARRSKSSTYAKAMGTWSSAMTDYQGNCDWWLRSPGNYTINVTSGYRDGCVSREGNYVDDHRNAIRPALHLNLSSSNPYSYAGTVCSGGTENVSETDTSEPGNGEQITTETEETTTKSQEDVTNKVPNETKDSVVKRPKTSEIKKIKKAKKSLKVFWKKIKGVSGYQIQYSISRKFKKAKKITIKKAKITSKSIKKLKAKKKYYVRIRTYIVVNGKEKYSNWSKTKSKKTK